MADNKKKLLLQDREHYIHSNGIENERSGSAPLFAEAEARVKDGSEYQNQIHSSIFGTDNADEKTGDESLTKKDLLKKLEGRTVSLRAADDLIEDVSLALLAASCDTVLVMTRSRLGVTKNTVSLDQFQGASVRRFLRILDGDGLAETLRSDSIVECCEMAHFLQCETVLSDVVDIMKRSVDSRNCMSMCLLADRLGIPSLFETSLSHMLGALEGLEGHEFWADLPVELRTQILTMQRTVRSSVVSGGQFGGVFFSSCEELVAILAENVQYHKERLCDAKERIGDVVRDRQRSRGSSEKDLDYTYDKIYRQEQRIKTLEMFYREQKTIFSGLGNIGAAGKDDM